MTNESIPAGAGRPDTRCSWFPWDLYDASNPDAHRCTETDTQPWIDPDPQSDAPYARDPSLRPRYCAHHTKLMRGVTAARDIRRDLIAAIHGWISGTRTLDEVRSLANQDLEARKALAKHGIRQAL